VQNDTVHQVESYSYILFDFCKSCIDGDSTKVTSDDWNCDHWMQ